MTQTCTEKRVQYPHPGEILSEEFMKPLRIRLVTLAGQTGISRIELRKLLTGRGGVTKVMDKALAKRFGMSEGFFRGLWEEWKKRKKRKKSNAEGAERKIDDGKEGREWERGDDSGGGHDESGGDPGCGDVERI